ncbi:unnamed protein product [Blepharisma stoltei]|uniref:RRM domain-containing protein n=1 Tax=Blepharisma stoltei TaxID=1481888 RepID=A0AAU9JQU0_9CILI|nr:unnamed protein product [Blepharisma stoltei]
MLLSIQRSFSRLFVRNIPKTATVQEIEEFAKNFGEIASLEVPTRDDKFIRGFAYITYRHEDDNIKASELIQTRSFKGTDLMVTLVKSDIKSQDYAFNSRQPFAPRKNYDKDPAYKFPNFYP